MNALPMIDMYEATRLTREGRLAEAMALLQGIAPRVPRETANRDRDPAQGSTLLDMQPPAEAGGAWTAPFARSPAQAKTPARAARVQVNEAPDRRPRPAFDLDAFSTARPVVGRAPLISGATFEERTYADQVGTRVYKLYVPSRFVGQPLPLLVMLHGCTQSPDDFAAGTQMNALAEEHLFLVAYPAQSSSANAQKCWNWFSAADQRRDQGEPALIAGITRHIMREFPVEAGRVFIAGLSAGGAAAATMGATYPDLYAAIGVHSGLACGVARDLPSAFTAMRRGGKVQDPGRRAGRAVPTIVFHGDRDTTVSAVNGDQVIAQAKAGVRLRAKVTTGRSAGGVAFTRTEHRDAQEKPVLEQWLMHGTGHAWSGGDAAGSFIEPRGPDASREMVRFFLAQSRALKGD